MNVEHIIYHSLNHACFTGCRIPEKNQLYLFNRFITVNINTVVVLVVVVVVLVVVLVVVVVVLVVVLVVVVAVIHYYDMLFYISISK
jgi:hypothetical protein